MTEYVKPQVWSWEGEKDERSGNRPTAGIRFEQVLPRGEQPLQVYSLGTPNGIKVAIMLEELKELGVTEAGYDLFLINIGKGDQFGSDFVGINPNSKIPALVDQSGDEEVKVFELAHILLYLAEKYDKLLPKAVHTKIEMMNWLFWQTGAAPFVGGGFGHFFHYAPTAQEYPINRYTMETKRQLDLLNQLLAGRPYIAGDDYSIADIAIWSWYGRLVEGKLYPGSATFLDVNSYKHLKAWTEKIAARPAVQRGLAVEYKSIGK
ncbi:glutathione-dependent disulfide-bond oxidoreductase [Streptococcus cuniculi]|uniref:Glutathione-dependent disulfide-bond oxidoreductase n=1 Tax=Streptococcus cuniculi TaxID=1432788 RepID=A0A4Y9J883_9STRE|nr:glutathione-dependent disulfide-bond oxidoreductase [Streptococcus cuniculi]MBF0779292.1 glutathione-dependent disulfide-bond oxidoreductase [Streptococcus cuniculi]TFU96711.1 glutathione-dependent disulfide-bond oxidoreductase [Streptococcus cuniculi]